MRLVFLHGINQQDREPDALRVQWTWWLREALPGSGALQQAAVEMPYYATVLDALTQGTGPGAAVAQGLGDGDVDAEEMAFIAGAMNEIASLAGISGQAIAAERRAVADTAVEQSLWMNRRVNAIGRLIERLSPAHGRFVLPLIRQAHAYLRKPGVAPAIDAIVMPALEKGPAVIVAHSLGTVIAFKLLRALAQAGRPVTCPLLVTMGSPIGLSTVSAALGVPFHIPPGVGHWVNAIEPNDGVTLGKPLDASTFCAGIQNIADIANSTTDNPHDAQGYLRDSRIAQMVEAALL
ncbi:hypothetical protein [Variovorax guangxiensis]|uniref:hypothetical protein n=1 Tax=Variovorax guangxiensis TaxID=1775474 RepID=UPI00285B526E|nr:hypothetical protein [Variovorax guangxiensis]MDR6859879.1 hypothetical protein [Variovorax guangxiensis]